MIGSVSFQMSQHHTLLTVINSEEKVQLLDRSLHSKDALLYHHFLFPSSANAWHFLNTLLGFLGLFYNWALGLKLFRLFHLGKLSPVDSGLYLLQCRRSPKLQSGFPLQGFQYTHAQPQYNWRWSDLGSMARLAAQLLRPRISCDPPSNFCLQVRFTVCFPPPRLFFLTMVPSNRKKW